MSFVDHNSTAILGTATGYTPDKILTFLNSLKNVQYKGDVVLFLNEDQLKDYQEFFKKINYPFKLKFVQTSIGVFYSSRKISKKKKKIIHFFSKYIVKKDSKLYKIFLIILGMPHVSRFFEYSDYLVTNKFKNVVLTDTRDVIFQKDLFKEPINGLFLGMEDINTPIGYDSFHIKWISDVYGQNYLKSISDKQISCAGVTFGDYESIKNYLNVMLTEFINIPYYTMVKCNYDQGIHNKLLYSNNFENVHKCQPLSSDILTLGLVNPQKIKVNSFGHILNEDGSIPAIVHQYDRHKNLEKMILKNYNL